MKRSRKRIQNLPSNSVDLLALAEHVERFSSKTIVLLGDFVADEFQFGDISRVSREAPVLILRHRETQLVPGGGANAANNFAALGARVLPVTVVGQDSAGESLLASFRSRRVDVSAIIRLKNWSTPTKTRFVAGWAHTVGQQVLRVDREPQNSLPQEARDGCLDQGRLGPARALDLAGPFLKLHVSPPHHRQEVIQPRQQIVLALVPAGGAGL